MYIRIIFTALLVYCSGLCAGQSPEEKIKKINTHEDAKNFLNGQAPGTADIMYISSVRDSTPDTGKLFAAKTGEMLKMGGYIYKVITREEFTSIRESYIYLDGSRLPKPRIDSLRKLIIKKYYKGISFPDLYKQYSMDGGFFGGDLGWSEKGMLNATFENEVMKRKKGELFTIDVPENRWYYVVLKTFDNRKAVSMEVLRVKEAGH